MNTNKFSFPELPYSYDSLEPYIDAKTMELHHTKHHKAYYDKFIGAIGGSEAENLCINDIFKNITNYAPVVRNNGGGYFNHSLFWQILTANSSKKPLGELEKDMMATFGNFENFKQEFTNAAINQFGSGWAWLSLDNNGKLFVSGTPNQDNPLMNVAERKGSPILGLDVWEHAYYLKYQNRRPEYIEAFWNVINWEKVLEKYIEVKNKL